MQTDITSSTGRGSYYNIDLVFASLFFGNLIGLVGLTCLLLVVQKRSAYTFNCGLKGSISAKPREHWKQ